MREATFERFAGACAIAVGLGGIGFSLFFVIFLANDASWAAAITELLLLVGGVLSIPVFVALYDHLRAVETRFALTGLLLGVAAAFGSAAHGGLDLSTRVEEPDIATDIANPTDPRGLATFALTGLALLVFSVLILRGDRLPRRLGQLGLLSGVLLLWVYLGRLLIVDPENAAVLIPAVVVGFVANPAWFVWLGLELSRNGGRASTAGRAGRRVEP